MRKRLLEQ